ncbi:hypothetical protein [Bacillus sp. AK128]
MDRKLVSIFQANESSPEVFQTMNDLATLSGVLSDLSSLYSFGSPGEILRFLRVIQLINEEALGLDEPIENAEMLYYRYRNRYQDSDPPSKKKVEQVINILVKYNWISKQSRRIKMRDVGKRMMDALIRLANDSLAYYMEDDIGRALFQARRDADLSEAYDDNGISGGNKIASMIRNVENAIQLIKDRELEMLADRTALPQLEKIHKLMHELDVKLKERIQAFETLEESLVLSNLMQKGTSALAEGTNLSLGIINKYLKFSHMQNTPLSSIIQPEKVREFIVQMYNPPLESDIPNVYQLFSFMEQNQYENEAIDGLWIPFKMAAPISSEAIDEAIYFMETYEPLSTPIEEETEELIYTTEELSEEDLDELMRQANWVLTKSMIKTEAIETYFEDHEEAPVEQVVIEATSSQWSDAINAVTAISALVADKKLEMVNGRNGTQLQHYEREWEWMNREDGSNIIRKRNGRKGPTGGGT